MLVKVDAYFDGEFWCARGINEDIFTQGETLDQLVESHREAVALHFEDRDIKPEILLMSEVQLGAPSATG